MKMHGLGDGPYWLISYAYFFCISSIYMLCFVVFGSVIGKNPANYCISYFLLIQLNLMLLTCRVEIFHTQQLRHPIRVLYNLYKSANCSGFSSSGTVFKC